MTPRRAVIIRCLSCRIQRTDAGRFLSLAELQDTASRNWNARPTQKAQDHEKAISDLERSHADALDQLDKTRRAFSDWLPAIEQTIDALKEDASVALRIDSIGRMTILAETLRYVKTKREGIQP